MAVWLGGLAALLAALHRPAEPVPPAVVTRFSRLALTSVAVLAVTGVYQSWRGLGSWDALTSTSYGRLLVVKVVLVALLLAGAAFSRRWTTRAATARTPAGCPGLAASRSRSRCRPRKDRPRKDPPRTGRRETRRRETGRRAGRGTPSTTGACAARCSPRSRSASWCW
ncbi:CopD family protein [Streptomyces sp. LN245]|uniref:CopD family protein n=1 Tax=Streptomyces sp. LN245 TaxID=3112975 RepID=UPI00371DACAF